MLGQSLWDMHLRSSTTKQGRFGANSKHECLLRQTLLTCCSPKEPASAPLAYPKPLTDDRHPRDRSAVAKKSALEDRWKSLSSAGGIKEWGLKKEEIVCGLRQRKKKYSPQHGQSTTTAAVHCSFRNQERLSTVLHR